MVLLPHADEIPLSDDLLNIITDSFFLLILNDLALDGLNKDIWSIRSGLTLFRFHRLLFFLWKLKLMFTRLDYMTVLIWTLPHQDFFSSGSFLTGLGDQFQC